MQIFPIVLILSFVGLSLQWGSTGHKIVAQIASDRLNQDAASKLQSYLGTNSLVDVAIWPDEYDHSPNGRWSSPCHFCNLPDGATSFSMSYCTGCCVVSAISNYTQILSNGQGTGCVGEQGVEPCAVSFLVHFVGDCHQPLHVSYASDRGGNEVRADFFGYQTNLHSVWDDSFISKAWNNDYQQATSALESIIQQSPQVISNYVSIVDPVIWANESFSYVLQDVYTYTTQNGEAEIGADYYNANLPIVQQRLIAAGVRLANLLNNLFSQ